MLIDLGRPEEALTLLAELGEDGRTGRAACLRSLAHLRLGDTSAAARAAEEARALEPHEEWGYRLGAAALLRRGRVRDANALALDAVRLAPHEPFAHQMAAETFLHAQQYDRARRHADEMLQLAPHSALAHETAGRIHLAQGLPGPAATSFRAALAIDPQDADCMALLADATQRLGDESGARTLRLEALRSDPQSADRQRDVLKRGGAAAAGSLFLLGKVGILGKLVAANVVIRGGRATFGSSVVLWLLVAAYLIAFVVTRVRRHRHGKTIPPLVWEGLRPHRRNDDLVWLAWPAGLAVLAGLLASAFGNLRFGLPALAGGLAALALCWRLRAGTARDLTPRQVLSRLRFVPVYLWHQRTQAPVGITHGEALEGPAVRDRWTRGALEVLAASVPALIGVAFGGPVPGVVAGLAAAALLGALLDSSTIDVSGMPFRICLAGTAVPAGRGRLALRAVLRFLLLPVVLVQLVPSFSLPARLVHDRISGTTVTGLPLDDFGAR
jgi:tetratricopeptide (TPR) repeat protein